MFLTRSPTPTSITTAEARTPWPHSRADSPTPDITRPLSEVSSGVGILHEPGPHGRPLTAAYGETEHWSDVIDLWSMDAATGHCSEMASVYSMASWQGGSILPAGPHHTRSHAQAAMHPLAQSTSAPRPPSPLSTLKSAERDLVIDNLEALARQVRRIESHGSRTPRGTPRGLVVTPGFNELMQRLEREASQQAATHAPAASAPRPRSRLKQRLKTWWRAFSAPLAKFAPRRSTRTRQTAA